MTYLRNPRNEILWESDGNLDGKFMAKDGTKHASSFDVERYEQALNGPAPAGEPQKVASNSPMWFVQQGIVYLQEVASWFRKEGKESLARSCENYADHLRECTGEPQPQAPEETK